MKKILRCHFRKSQFLHQLLLADEILNEHTEQTGYRVVGDRPDHYIVVMAWLRHIYITVCHHKTRPLLIGRIEYLYLQSLSDG